MLAPTESRTILPVEGCKRLESGPDDTTTTVLITWRLRVKRARHCFLADVIKKSDLPGSCMDILTNTTAAATCGTHHNVSATDDCESSRVHDRRYESGFSCLERNRWWRSTGWQLDRSGLSRIHVWSLILNDDQLRSTSKLVMISDDDY